MCGSGPGRISMHDSRFAICIYMFLGWSSRLQGDEDCTRGRVTEPASAFAFSSCPACRHPAVCNLRAWRSQRQLAGPEVAIRSHLRCIVLISISLILASIGITAIPHSLTVSRHSQHPEAKLSIFSSAGPLRKFSMKTSQAAKPTKLLNSY